jgi:hypothetical protein
MQRMILSSRSVQVALAVCVLALAAAAWTGVNAFRITPVTPAAPPSFPTAASLAKTGMSVPPDVGAAVAMNPFSPARKAPAVRYRLSGYGSDVPATPPPQPVVLGTVVAAGNRSFAYCSVGDSRATVVRVGDLIGGYTVKSIERGLVVFSTPAGDKLVITAK